MSTSSDLKGLFTEALPLIDRWLDLRDEFAALRDAATAKGIDWGQVKALAKAHAEDARDESGEGKRVRRIIDKADYASAYADMLGLAKLNEKNSFPNNDRSTGADGESTLAGRSKQPASDVDVALGKRTPEKVEADPRTAADRPSSEGGHIASAGASLIPRTNFELSDLPEFLDRRRGKTYSEASGR